MLGRTHFYIGTAAALAVLQPQTVPALVAGAGAAAIGGLISDIDVGTSQAHRDADKIITATVAAAVLTILAAYLISLMLLVLFNNVIKIRASGHACSVTSPLFFATYYFGLGALLPAAVLYATIFWASIVTKRHTVKEFLLGSAVCIVSATMAIFVLML